MLQPRRPSHHSQPSHALAHAEQGQEERIIFISTVLSRPDSLPPPSGGSQAGAAAGSVAADVHLGFWRNPRRFNVAVTRAKALLVVVGQPAVLLEDHSWRELLRWAPGLGVARPQPAPCFVGHRALACSVSRASGSCLQRPWSNTEKKATPLLSEDLPPPVTTQALLRYGSLSRCRRRRHPPAVSRRRVGGGGRAAGAA